MAAVVGASLKAGKVTVTYDDNTTRVITQDQAKKEGIKIGTTAGAGGDTSGSYGSPDNAFVTDQATGQTVSGTLTVPTKNGNKTLTELVMGSRDPAKLGSIRTQLIDAGLISKGTKNPTTILNVYTSILAGAASSKMDPDVYISTLKANGFGQDVAATKTGTVSYPTISGTTDAEASINKVFQSRLSRDATAAEIKKYTSLLNKEEAKTPTKVTYSATGQKTTTGVNVDQYLSDLIDKDKPLKGEADVLKIQAPDLTKRLADKKIYDKLIDESAGDPARIEAAKNSTAYGRGLKEFEALVASSALSKGLVNTPDELSNIAKELYDQGTASNSQVVADAIAKIAKYGVGEAGNYTGTAGTTFDDLQKTAAANGLDLNKTFGSNLNSWIAAVDKGESIDTFKKLIRDTAKIGMPEKVAKLLDQGVDLQTIYTPYKNLMASTLEINPATITMNDPTLRSAITSDAEVPLYQFERQLRKDNRWQYTNQAKSEVGDATQQILKDFGFMG